MTGLLALLFSASLASAAPAPGGALHRVTYDLGASVGGSGDKNYTEAQLGLNLFFTDWFAWRNAAFARFQSGTENIFGLDSSARAILNVGDRSAGLTAFVGPGVRVPSRGQVAAFGEGGLVFKLGGLAIGGGAKLIFSNPTDTQYFLILAGGGSL